MRVFFYHITVLHINYRVVTITTSPPAFIRRSKDRHTLFSTELRTMKLNKIENQLEKEMPWNLG